MGSAHHETTVISQKRALKVEIQLPKCTPSAIVFSQAKVLTINNMHELQLVFLPESFSSIIIIIDIHAMYVYNNEFTNKTPDVHLNSVSQDDT